MKMFKQFGTTDNFPERERKLNCHRELHDTCYEANTNPRVVLKYIGNVFLCLSAEVLAQYNVI